MSGNKSRLRLLVGALLSVLLLSLVPPLVAQEEFQGGIPAGVANPFGDVRSQDGDGFLNNSLRVTLNGDVTSAGVGLRGVGAGNINLAGIPAGASIYRAFLYWATIGQNVFPTVNLNGVPVSGTLIGTGGVTCWDNTPPITDINRSYRADVTARVAGNGVYSISGLPASGPTNNDSQGASLVVLYTLPGAAPRTIVINDGAVTLAGSGASHTNALSGFTPNSPLTNAKLTLIVGDGASNFFEGTQLFKGLPLVTNPFVGSNGNYWDNLTYDVTSFAPTSPVTTTLGVNVGTNVNQECFLWVANILSVTTIAPAETNLVANGDFSQPLTNTWTFYNAANQVNAGVLRVARQAGSAEGGFYQLVNFNVPAGAPMEITFTMGNASNVPKSVAVILRSSTTWTGAQSCSFFLNPLQPTQLYTMRVLTPAAWFPMLLQFALGEPDSNLGLDIDNIDLRYRPGTPGGNVCQVLPPANTNVIFDGGFNFGFSSWAVFGNPFAQIVPVNGNNTLELMRFVGSPTEPGVYQFNPYSMPAGAPVELTLRLGNRSPQFKTLAVVLRNADWSNLNVCYFGLPPNSPIQAQVSPYVMRVKPTVNWQTTVFQIFVLQADGSQAAQIDDVNVQYRPTLSFTGNRRCFLPNGVEVTETAAAGIPAEPNAAQPQAVEPVIGDGGIVPLPPTTEGGVAPLPPAEGGIAAPPADDAKPE